MRPSGHYPPRLHNDGNGESWAPWGEAEQALAVMAASTYPTSEESA